MDYPSASEIKAARESAEASRFSSFEQVAEMALPMAEKMRFHRLEHKIPPELRGLFGIQIENDKVTGLALLPNNATRIMNEWPIAGLDNNRGRHHSAQIGLWTGADLEKILMSLPLLYPDAFISAPQMYQRTEANLACDEARGHGLTYDGTYTVNQLLLFGTKHLSHADQHQLHRAAAHIPPSLRGAFVCDVSHREKGEQLITGIGIDPIAICNRITLDLLDPVLAPDGGHLLQPSMRAGIHPHQHVYMLGREAYEQLAAAKPPAPVRGRAS